MRPLKRGEKGIAANYITRNKAVRKLQISLKDFRRLCILKGIYPRDPKKKRKGKDKTYYHVKDIKFLQHEPLLMKFRELKIFMRRHKTAVMKKDFSKAEKLMKNKPVVKVDHLIKERYPTFDDALRDLDDPLTMVHLFATLPAKLTTYHGGETSVLCARLAREFQSYIVHERLLRKVFVSIKGYYYRAEVHGHPITWLVPHKFSQRTPQDIDYKIMLTFLQFYESMIEFVNHHLYHHIGLVYPPLVDEIKDAQRLWLQGMVMEKKQKGASKASSSGAKPKQKLQGKDLQSLVNSVVKGLKPQAEANGEAMDDEDEDEDENDEEQAEEAEQQEMAETFKRELTKEEELSEQQGKLFAGLTFVLSRETPFEPLEFVIMCGGGVAVREDGDLAQQLVKDKRVTHQVVDRKKPKEVIPGRVYVQPQWVFDSFNCIALLPSEPYAPGAKLPPHLSPFVDDEKEGYTPAQKQQLIEWGAQGLGEAMPKESEDSEEEDEEDEDEAAEKRYNAELEKEKSGVLYSQSKEGEDSDDDDDEGEDSSDDDDEDEEVEDSSDDEDAVEGAGESRSNKRKRAESNDNDEDEASSEEAGMDDDSEEEEEEEEVVPKTRKQEEKELAKIMMDKKSKRLYGRMQYGIAQKKKANDKLMAKRLRAEAKENKKKSKGNKAGKTKKKQKTKRSD